MEELLRTEMLLGTENVDKLKSKRVIVFGVGGVGGYTCEALARELGFTRISILSPVEHDKMIAFLSQLTHCIAVTLMTANTSEGLEKYTGDSFRDLTRIAKINDAMWSELFLMNKDALLSEMDAFISEFTRLRSMIELGEREGMREMMRESTRRRSLFDKQ